MSELEKMENCSSLNPVCLMPNRIYPLRNRIKTRARRIKHFWVLTKETQVKRELRVADGSDQGR